MSRKFLIMLLLVVLISACTQNNDNNSPATGEPVFGDDSEINKSCSFSSDCKLPGSYAKISSCPYEMRCIGSKCTPVCPWDEK